MNHPELNGKETREIAAKCALGRLLDPLAPVLGSRNDHDPAKAPRLAAARE
jgi:hypothetical protein